MDRFDAVLVDLNGTLAEDFDRFGPGQDYVTTYRRLGGSALAPRSLTGLIDSLMTRILRRYEDGPPDPFPSLAECLAELVELPAAETERIDALVAEHERGTIPQARVDLVETLGRSHRLGLVSDLWASSGCYRRYLDQLGLSPMFGSIVISSEHGAVKPGPRLFRTALSELGVAPERAVFVGDHESRDILGAAACGMSTVWIDAEGRGPTLARPDRVVVSLEALPDLV
ncbi:MAG: HAD family hydrolase [Gammaproteobacteria bacterium]